MYRNSEGYADPTVGAALAHIAYEERRKRRTAKQAEKRKAAAQKKLKQERKKSIRRKQTEERFRNTHWVLAWSADPAIEAKIKEGRNAVRPEHKPSGNIL